MAAGNVKTNNAKNEPANNKKNNLKPNGLSKGPQAVRYTQKTLNRANCFCFAMSFTPDTWSEFHKNSVFLQIRGFPSFESEALSKSGGDAEKAFQYVKNAMIKSIISMLTIHKAASSKTPNIPLVFKSKATAVNLYKTHPALRKALGPVAAVFYQIAVFAAIDFEHNGEGSDFHFATRTEDGTWKHKPGGSEVTDKDAYGNKITNIATAKLRVGANGPWYRFCGILWVLHPTTRRLIVKHMNIPGFDELGVVAIENAAYVMNDRILHVR